MSISKIFYTLIGDKSVVLLKAESENDTFIFKARFRADHGTQCPCCKSRNVKIKETKERTFRACNIGPQRAYVKIDVKKIKCADCSKHTWQKPGFSYGKLPLTKSFINYITQLTLLGPLLGVALLLGLSWKTIKNIDKTNLKKRRKQFSFKKLRYLSIDEIAIRKGHKYMTIVSDIQTGQIIFAVLGRSEEVLRPFLKRLAKKAKRLRAIGIDMSAAYASSVKKHLPNVTLVFDRFHVTQLLNNTLDEIRRAEYVKHKEEGKKIIKGQRFLLLRNFADLDTDEKSSLAQLLEVNLEIAKAHGMKEQFGLFWEQPSKKAAAKFLGWWIIEAFESGIRLLVKTARSLLSRWEGLLSYFDHKINNGKAEGINNKIKVLKRQAYGFRDLEYFKLKLYHLHRKKVELVG